MNKLKVGDRVRIYWGSDGDEIGEVTVIKEEGLFEYNIGPCGDRHVAHYKQCRKIKRKPIVIWLNEYAPVSRKYGYHSQEEAKLKAEDGCIGQIHFKEVMEK